MDQLSSGAAGAFFKAERQQSERLSKVSRHAVELVFESGMALIAAVRAGYPPIEALRSRLEKLFTLDGPWPRASLEWVVRAIDHWAVERSLVLVRTETLHWGSRQLIGAMRTYLLRAEQDLVRQIDAGPSVILATTEEPRRFARFMLRHCVGTRPVYLWTVASGLFKVSGSPDDLSFARPGDPDSCTLEGRWRRLSECCSEEGEEPHQLRFSLTALRDYDCIGVEVEEGRNIRAFLKQQELENGLRLDLVIDDDAADEDTTVSDLECHASYELVSRRRLEEYSARLVWPPRSQSLLGGVEKPTPFLGEIQYIMAIHQSAALFVMLDANIFLETSGPVESASIAATFLKDASARLRRARTGTQILVLSTPLTLTRSLTDELVCIELPLPSRNELVVELRRQLTKNGIDLRPAGATADDRYQVSEEMSMLSDAAAGMTLQDLGAAVRRACSDWPATVPAILDALQVAKRAAVKRSPALELVDQLPPRQISLGGVDRLLTWLGVRRRVFEHPEQAKNFGIERRPKGVLLLGIPGTGKSLAAKVIAREWNLPLVRLDMGAIQNMFVGASEQRIREALRIVEATSPCVLWIDEIDKGVAQGEGTASHSTDLNIRATLLTWLQESRAAVFCVATANRFASLPPELTRAGRFDARFFLGCPNESGRRQILDIHLAVRGLMIDEGATDRALKAMHGFTGAEIEQSVLDGLYAAFAEGRQLVADDIVRAAERVKPIVRAVGSGLDEVWALVDQGRVELASDQFLSRSDLAKLIDPMLFSPMYCRLQAISGWDRQATRAERMLMVDPMGPSAAAFLETGDPAWIYVQLNVRYAPQDAHFYKFLDRTATVGQNGILDVLVSELGIEVFYVESQALADRLVKEPGFGAYAELFQPVQPRADQ